MTGMTGWDGELDYSKMVHWVLSAPSYGKTTGDAPWRGLFCQVENLLEFVAK